MKRNRLIYAFIICLVVPLGLASRRYSAALPSFVAEYAGDTLWALMAFLGIGLIASKSSTLRVAVAALMLSYGVEISQFYHADWIDSIRSTHIGALALGYGFIWSDIVCYTAGVAFGAAVEAAFHIRPEKKCQSGPSSV